MKFLLLLCFFSPLLTVALIYWDVSGGEKTLEPILQGVLGTAALFWIWFSASQRLVQQPLDD